MSLPPAAVLLDIEGTTTPISFVHDVLFPFALARLEAFCAATEHQAILADVPDPKLAMLQGWMALDEKIPVLKTIQGIIWDEGYRQGDLKGVLYPDVEPCLRRWVRSGVRLYIYSSGSVQAQKLLFGYAVEGNLTSLIQGFFDTGVGPKREASSYVKICRGANIQAAEFLFLSDNAEELDAAAQAGLRTCQIQRAQDGTHPTLRHPGAMDFPAAAKRFSLPG